MVVATCVNIPLLVVIKLEIWDPTVIITSSGGWPIEGTRAEVYKCGLVRPQNTFPLCISPSQISLGPEKSTVLLNVVDVWLHFAR